jgi:hypothetical protein
MLGPLSRRIQRRGFGKLNKTNFVLPGLEGHRTGYIYYNALG